MSWERVPMSWDRVWYAVRTTYLSLERVVYVVETNDCVVHTSYIVGMSYNVERTR